MTEEQYLLNQLAEECVEIAQRCSKAIRFGLNHTGPNSSADNDRLIFEEYCDLLAAVDMLRSRGLLKTRDPIEFSILIKLKTEKVEKMMEYSRSLGRLEAKEGESGKSEVDGDVGRADVDERPR